MIEIELAELVPDRPLKRPERLREAVLRVLEEAGVRSAEISLAVLSDDAIHQANRQYLQHDYPTDVLSFRLDEAASEADLPAHLEGELLVSHDTAARQAVHYGWDAEDELLLYVIHGALHLVGYDDQNARGRAVMRQAEARHLALFRLSSPGGNSGRRGPAA